MLKLNNLSKKGPFYLISLIGLGFGATVSTLGSPLWASSGSLPLCPDTRLQETEEDCPWAGASRALQAEASASRPLEPLFESFFPKLTANWRADTAQEGLKRIWGKSINFDEGAKGTIVHPAILDSLAKALGVPPRQERIVHAGLEHTYGYLFSTLLTSFGYKRARWVRPDIEEGLGIPRGLLGPEPKEGTLFSNLTYFLGRISLKDDSEAQAILSAASPAVASFLTDFPYDSLKTRRLEETMSFKGVSGKERSVSIRTDFVLFHTPAEKGNSALLIYSVSDSEQKGSQLITAFPVAHGFMEKALNSKDLGKNQPIRTRYNAFISGVTDVNPPRTGIRKVH